MTREKITFTHMFLKTSYKDSYNNPTLFQGNGYLDMEQGNGNLDMDLGGLHMMHVVK